MRVTPRPGSTVYVLLRGPVGVAFALAVVMVAAVFVSTRPEPVTDPVPAGTARDNPCWRTTRAERAFARKMNKVRRRQGRGSMRLDPELSKVARVHTRSMVRRRTLYHTPSSSLRRRVTGWRTLGENVGVGNTVGSLHKAFLHSPAHRHNILYSSFRHSGVGVSKRGGRMWVTVIFEASRNPGTRLRMPRC
jgi:uncharacterized protein YkwD